MRAVNWRTLNEPCFASAKEHTATAKSAMKNPHRAIERSSLHDGLCSLPTRLETNPELREELEHRHEREMAGLSDDDEFEEGEEQEQETEEEETEAKNLHVAFVVVSSRPNRLPWFRQNRSRPKSPPRP